eukprot:15467433-Alexandrium_andersonii.AAC.1
MHGVWTARDMHRMCVRDSAKCPWCDAPCEDVVHAWFECPTFEDIRKDVWGEQAPRVDAIPALLAKTGWAPALCPMQQGPFWGTVRTVGQPDSRCMWDEPPPTACVRAAQSVGVGVSELLSGALSARLVEDRLQGGEGEIVMPQLPKVQGTPGEQPSVFTDGTVDPPACPRRAVAAFGVWCQEAQVDGEPPLITPGSEDFYMQGGDGGGTSYWGLLAARHPSSTRAEIVALLMSLL